MTTTKESAKHTPEPWVRDGTIWAPAKLEIDLRLDDDGNNWVTIKGPNAEANARLIGSAPELLKALESYMSGHPCSSQAQEPEATTNCPTLIEARTAISKATEPQP